MIYSRLFSTVLQNLDVGSYFLWSSLTTMPEAKLSVHLILRLHQPHMFKSSNGAGFRSQSEPMHIVLLESKLQVPEKTVQNYASDREKRFQKKEEIANNACFVYEKSFKALQHKNETFRTSNSSYENAPSFWSESEN